MELEERKKDVENNVRKEKKEKKNCQYGKKRLERKKKRKILRWGKGEENKVDRKGGNK